MADPSSRLRDMLEAPIAPMLVRMSLPNMLMLLAQASTGLVETWLLAKLGTDTLAGIAVVVPVLMLMQNMSGGAMGGGISSAVARALGAGETALAQALPRQAVVLGAAIGVAFAALLLLFHEPLFRFLGATGVSLAVADRYGTVISAGIALLWVMNALASVIRGTGNMLVPGAVICVGALFLVPLGAALIFGFGPLPALGVVGGAVALVGYYLACTLVLGWYARTRNAARLEAGPLRWDAMRKILRVGALACVNSLLTNALIALTASLVGRHAGTESLAGYATAARLEYLLMPIAFGLGAPMVALVGANIGAGQARRARRIALAGGAMAFVLGEAVGLAAAIWPHAWPQRFGTDPRLLETGAHYLRIAGPCYGFFAMGFSLYFASQGAGRLRWPLIAGGLRILIFVGVGGAVLGATGSLSAFFAIGAIAMVTYGVCIAVSVASGGWLAGDTAVPAFPSSSTLLPRSST